MPACCIVGGDAAKFRTVFIVEIDRAFGLFGAGDEGAFIVEICTVCGCVECDSRRLCIKHKSKAAGERGFPYTVDTLSIGDGVSAV